MELISSSLAIIALILVILVLLGFILGDLSNAKQYHNATRVQGVVCENYGIEKVAYYGRHQYRKYGRYLIRFSSPAGLQTQEVLLKNRKLQRGDMVEVRYIVSQEGVQLVDNISGARLLEFAISLMIVLPICLVIMSFIR